MKSARLVAISALAIGLLFNAWSFRWFSHAAPIDAFLRLMALPLDALLLGFTLVFAWTNESFPKRLVSLITQFPRSSSIFIGLSLCYCLLMGLEFGCRYYFNHIYEAPYTEQTDWEPNPTVPDSIMGLALPRNENITHRYTVNDSLIYEQIYRTDEFGRRINPTIRPDSMYHEFVAVTGCSFAFGYGLNERETLSHFLDSLSGKRAYNYAVSGYGPQQTLALLQHRNLNQEIAEKNGVLIHLFIDDHLPRLIGSRRLIKLWARSFPYYFLDGNELKQSGTFWTGRRFTSRFYLAISQSAFIDLFDIDFPWYVIDAHLTLYSKVQAEARSEFQKQFPQGRFIVVIGPNSRLSDRVVEALAAENVEVLDLSNLIDSHSKHYKIHWTERHPNAAYYEELASAIHSYLARNEHQ